VVPICGSVMILRLEGAPFLGGKPRYGLARFLRSSTLHARKNTSLVCENRSSTYLLCLPAYLTYLGAWYHR